MKNKTIAFLVVVSLLALPAVALAAKAVPASGDEVSFTLGGYIKLHMFWDSAALHKNWLQPPARNNDPNGQHGRFDVASQSSRFNFTIKGPNLWGAKTTGYIEIDFDRAEDRQSASESWTPRLRHAFFRFNWPGTELLMGQYWSYFCEYYPESIQDGPFQGHGQATHRLAQVRLTQTFGLGWAKDDKLALSAMIGEPTSTQDSGDPNYPIATGTGPLEDQTTETPQLQAKIRYDGDLWGKAGFYGSPKPFSAQVCFGWQRSRYRNAHRATFIGIQFEQEQKYLDNWALQGTLFIPIIPTATKNLAGTSALTLQAYVGQGLDFIGNDISNSYLSRTGIGFFGLINTFEVNLQRVWGGYASLNYYFSNAWFANVMYGFASNYGVGGADAERFATQVHNWWEINANLYYRPISAFKFGLGYAYTRANYYRPTLVGSQLSDIGEAHRLQFAGWFFF